MKALVLSFANGVSPAASDVGDAKNANRKASALGVSAGAAAGGFPTPSEAKATERAMEASAAAADFPGPATHAPTQCGDQETHFGQVLSDEIIPAPLGKVYSMVFGPASGGFMSRWLMDEIKVTELEMEDDRKGISAENPSRSYTYIKPFRWCDWTQNNEMSCHRAHGCIRPGESHLRYIFHTNATST